MEHLFAGLQQVWLETARIWVSGGWCMPPLAMLAFATFALGLHVHLRLREKEFQSVPEAEWRRWIEVPSRREGPIGRILDSVTGTGSLERQAIAFADVRATELVPFTRDLKVMKVCIAAAPLIGLLGTVTGMLGTFDALASGAGGDKTMELVAKGISEALVTTETGLVIALPALFLRYLIGRRHEEYDAFLAHLETVCNQHLHRRLSTRGSAA